MKFDAHEVAGVGDPLGVAVGVAVGDPDPVGVAVGVPVPVTVGVGELVAPVEAPVGPQAEAAAAAIERRTKGAISRSRRIWPRILVANRRERQPAVRAISGVRGATARGRNGGRRYRTAPSVRFRPRKDGHLSNGTDSSSELAPGGKPMNPERQAAPAPISGPIGLLIVDGGLRVVAADRMFTELFGLESTEIVGHTIDEVLGYQEMHFDLLDVLLFGATYSDRLLQAKLNGAPEPRTVRISASCVHFEGPDDGDGLFVTVEDLSAMT
jgi:PAS domain-containing protein